MSEKVVVVTDENGLAIKRKRLQEVDGYAAPTDEQTTNAINAWLDAHPEATTTVQDESLSYKKLIPGTLGFVTPEMFGAKGDGITNDYSAIANCIAFANRNNLPVLFSGKTYRVTGGTIYVQMSLYGNGSTILLDNETTSVPLFLVGQETTNPTATAWSDVFADKNTVKDEYKDSFFVLRTSLSLGYRFGNSGNEQYFVKIPFAAQGNKAKWPSTLPTTGFTVEVTKKSSVYVNGVTIRDFVVKCDNTFFPQFLSVERNNCVISNITGDITGVLASRVGYLINTQNCNNVIYRDINIRISGASTDLWKYCLSFYNCANCTLENSNIISTWQHGLSTNSVNNMTYKNVTSDGIDCHVNQYGNTVIESCNVGACYIGSGDGFIDARNTVFTGSSGFVCRNDYTQRFSGIIKALNCKFNGYGYSDQIITPAIISDGSRSEQFNSIVFPRIEYYDCEMQYPVKFYEITDESLTVTYKPVLINHSVFSHIGTWDGDTYHYIYPIFVIVNCEFDFEGFGDKVHIKDSRVTFKPTTNGNKYPVNKVAIENSDVKFNVFTKALDIYLRNSNISYANYSSGKANSITYDNCTGKIEACANYIYVFGGQYTGMIYNTAPTGCVINAIYDAAASWKSRSTIMSLNVLDANHDTDLIPLRNAQTINDRPKFDDVLILV